MIEKIKKFLGFETEKDFCNNCKKNMDDYIEIPNDCSDISVMASSKAYKLPTLDTKNELMDYLRGIIGREWKNINKIVLDGDRNITYIDRIYDFYEYDERAEETE